MIPLTPEMAELMDRVRAWMDEPDVPMTPQELARPVYDARGKLLARTRAEYDFASNSENSESTLPQDERSRTAPTCGTAE